MTAPKEKSPNAAIDKAIKDLMKEMDAENAAPDVLKAKVAVLQTAMKWEAMKHKINDNQEFDPSSL